MEDEILKTQLITVGTMSLENLTKTEDELKRLSCLLHHYGIECEPRDPKKSIVRTSFKNKRSSLREVFNSLRCYDKFALDEIVDNTRTGDELYTGYITAVDDKEREIQIIENTINNHDGNDPKITKEAFCKLLELEKRRGGILNVSLYNYISNHFTCGSSAATGPVPAGGGAAADGSGDPSAAAAAAGKAVEIEEDTLEKRISKTIANIKNMVLNAESESVDLDPFFNIVEFSMSDETERRVKDGTLRFKKNEN